MSIKPGHRIFSSIPGYGRKRIFGTENEYGTEWGRKRGRSLPDLEFIPNGGKIYEDCDHMEYCTPECSNPLEAVVYGKAGELLSLPFADKLYKNNVAENANSFQDRYSSFGAHENYSVKDASWDYLEEIIPFLLTRQIFSGSGWLRDGQYLLSQKSPFIIHRVDYNTTFDRAILCTKDSPLSSKGRRLHLILGDANMCEVADFLKLGTTGLVLDLLEDGRLPRTRYNQDRAVDDLQALCYHPGKWKLGGISRDAISLQQMYLEAAAKHYQGRDEITNEILARWDHVLNTLRKDPMQLIGTLDWVTKKALIDGYARGHNLGMDDPRLANIDLQYHDVDRNTSLFYQLQTRGRIERMVTDALIKRAMNRPPQDTRAKFRGYAVKRIQDQGLNVGIEWEELIIYSDNDEEDYGLELPDPFCTYDALKEEFRKKLRRMKQ
jgi:proteasome accessory factor A